MSYNVYIMDMNRDFQNKSQEQRLLTHLRANPFLLAPMAGITDSPFRSFMREMGCGIVVTELVSATGLKFSSEKTRKLMGFDPIQHPVGIQLFGEDLETLAEAAREVEAMGADFVDLNFGCPVPKVVKKGAGSALLKDLSQLTKVLSAVRAAVSIPVTIKVRTGWDQSQRNTHEVVKIAYNEGMTWVAIHGRTRAQGYSGQADWEYIREVQALSPLPIIGNGDITSAELAVERLKQTACDGVMIGRGCLKNPWIFLESMALWQQSQFAETPFLSSEEGFVRKTCVTKDFGLLLGRLRHYLRHGEERIAMLQLKKFAAWYSAGYPGSAQFRKEIFQAKEFTELNERVDHFFSQLALVRQADTSHEPFLMGGHG